MSNRFQNLSGLSYLGTRATQPPNMVFLEDRDPNQYDNKDVSIGDLCLRKDNEALWYLGSLAGDANSQGVIADWIPFGGAGGETSLRADDLVVADPAAGIIKTSGNGINLFTTAFGTPSETVMHLKNIGLIGPIPAGLVYFTEDGGTHEDTLTGIGNGAIGTVLTINGAGIPEWAAPGTGGTVTSVSGGDNLNTTGGITSPIVVVNLDKSIRQPATNADASQGVYALGATDYETDRFLHAAGDRTNTFVGYQSGNFATITGAAEDNTGAGNLTLSGLTVGKENTALGAGALNTITTGSYNTAVGRFAGSTLTGADSNNILIGHFGTIGDNHKIRIGRQGLGNLQQDETFIVGIYAQFPPTSTPRVVTVNSNHQLQTVTSGTNGHVLTLVAGIPTWQPGGGGAANVFEGQNINFTVPLSTVNLNTSVHLLSTTVDGLTGVIAIGTTVIADGPPAGVAYINDRFVHRYGTRNTFLGFRSGRIDAAVVVGTATDNAAFGYQSLGTASLTTGFSNTAGGSLSGTSLNSGSNNALYGANSGTNLTTATNNSIVGAQSGTILTTGGSNSIFGKSAGSGANGTTSASNVVIGVSACATNFNANFNTIVGPSVAPTMRGDYNVIIGNSAGDAITNAVGANNNIYISNQGANENKTIRIGTDDTGGNNQVNRAFMAGIWPQNASGTNNKVVVANQPGQLRVVTQGTEGQVLTLFGAGLLPTWRTPGGGGGGTIVNIFDNDGVWNINPNTKMVTIYLWNGGGGGGGGYSRPAPFSGIQVGGGGGGGGGACGMITVSATYFNAAENVIIGVGGAGGISSPGGSSTNGQDGGVSSVGNISIPTTTQLDVNKCFEGSPIVPGLANYCGGGGSGIDVLGDGQSGGWGGYNSAPGGSGPIVDSISGTLPGVPTYPIFISNVFAYPWQGHNADTNGSFFPTVKVAQNMATTGGGGGGVGGLPGYAGGSIISMGTSTTILTGGAAGGLGVAGSMGNIPTAAANHGAMCGGTGGGGGGGGNNATAPAVGGAGAVPGGGGGGGGARLRSPIISAQGANGGAGGKGRVIILETP